MTIRLTEGEKELRDIHMKCKERKKKRKRARERKRTTQSKKNENVHTKKKHRKYTAKQIEDYESRFFVFAFNVFIIPRSASLAAYKMYGQPHTAHQNRNILAHTNYLSVNNTI